MPHRTLPLLLGVTTTLLLNGSSPLHAKEAQEPDVQAETETVDSASLELIIPQEPAPNGYRAMAQIDELMESYEARELCKTPDGRSLWLASFGQRNAPGRPAILLVANLNGNRLVATEVALELCQHLNEASALLDVATVHVIAAANPDAAARALSGEYVHRGRGLDEDFDGRVDEDGPDDIDGDGQLLQMLVEDATGEWLLDEEHPLLLRKADRSKGERGKWRLEMEGLDNDGDQDQAEDGPGGVNLQNNFPHRWRAHRPESGVFQLSEPESRALADFVLETRHLALVIVLDAEDNLSDPPSGKSQTDKDSTEPREDDVALLKVLGERLYQDLEHKPVSADHGHGGFSDWVYFQVGIPVLESAVWSPPVDGDKEKRKSKLIEWASESLIGGFVPWEPAPESAFDDNRKRMIGGWAPLVRNNPSAIELPRITERWMGFIESLAEDFAQIQLAEPPQIKSLGGGVFDVEVTIVNPSLLATVSKMGEATRRRIPVRAVLELPTGGELLSGNRLQAVPRLEGLGGHHKLRWMIRIPEGKTTIVRLMSRTAGELVITIPSEDS
jgi:hypothetical protein